MNLKRLMGLAVFALFVISAPTFGQYAPYYVLDGYGGVHAGGGAAAISPKTPYFGWDIARGMDYVPVSYNSANYGHGILVLDGYGGVHKGGKMSVLSLTLTPYFGWDIARDIVTRIIPPSANYSTANTGNQTVTSTTFVSIRSTALVMPDDGYVMIAAGCSMGNNDTDGFVRARVAVGVDSTTTPVDSIEWEIGLKKWVTTELDQWRNVNVTQMKFLSAGYHTFYFLVRKMVSTDLGTISYYDPTISVIYVDKASSGYSGVEEPVFEDLAPPTELGTGSIKQ